MSNQTSIEKPAYFFKIGTTRYVLTDEKPTKIVDRLTTEEYKTCSDFLLDYSLVRKVPLEAFTTEKQLIEFITSYDVSKLASLELTDGDSIKLNLENVKNKITEAEIHQMITDCYDEHNIIMTTTECKSLLKMLKI